MPAMILGGVRYGETCCNHVNVPNSAIADCSAERRTDDEGNEVANYGAVAAPSPAA